MTTDISSDGLMAIYEALGAAPEGNIAVKLSTGEPGSNYLRTDLIGELVQSLDATIVECNTAYGGSRSNTAMHKQVAADHGYTEIADVDIMDEKGKLALTVTGGDNLAENYVGSHFANYDYFVVLSHSRVMPWRAMAGRSRIFPSGSPPPTERATSIPAVPVEVCGAAIRTHSRAFQMLLDLLLLLDMAALCVSGVMMSGFVFRFLRISGVMMIARQLALPADTPIPSRRHKFLGIRLLHL